MSHRSLSPGVAAAVLLVAAAMAAGLFWRLTLRGVEREIAQYRTKLTGLRLSGRVPPNREVMAYLTRRMEALQTQYQQARSLIAPAATQQRSSDADPQLAFQERMHEVQRTLERLTTARGIPIPLELGLPKELPPAEAVPRFLMQLGLIEGLAELAMTVDGVSQLVSFKAEDPRVAVPAEKSQAGAEPAAFVTALPVQVHLSCSLSALTKLLHLIDRAQPVMALQRVQIVAPGEATAAANQPALDVELIVARYIVSE